MWEILLILFFQLGFSFFASLLDGVLVGATASEMEELKRKSPRLGAIFEHHHAHTDRTLSAILAIDTGATCIGSIVLGSLLEIHYGSSVVLPVSIFVSVIGFVFSDILPKVIGICYRRKILGWCVYPISVVSFVMGPVALLCSKIVGVFLPAKRFSGALSDETLILTAQKGVRDGVFSSIEGEMVEHTLTLDDVDVETITQKKVFSICASQTVGEIFRKYPEIPYGRIPVYDGERRNIVGIVLRREMLRALAADEHEKLIKSMMRNVVRIPQSAKISSALDLLLQHFQQIAVIDDADGNPIGVLTLEDIFEYIIGRDIFEYDDLSNYSRDDARKLRLLQKKHVGEKIIAIPRQRKRKPDAGNGAERQDGR
ncbi:MAG: CNNM domain-containing protein [Puniceicoccales bacterium]|jgi:CBS domain containing-hemolysin-like protein|nr:CNNM domain-containing protein [Puniceicoccales bacterium]